MEAVLRSISWVRSIVGRCNTADKEADVRRTGVAAGL